jgi:hypothetical protein
MAEPAKTRLLFKDVKVAVFSRAQDEIAEEKTKAAMRAARQDPQAIARQRAQEEADAAARQRRMADFTVFLDANPDHPVFQINAALTETADHLADLIVQARADADFGDADFSGAEAAIEELRAAQLAVGEDGQMVFRAPTAFTQRLKGAVRFFIPLEGISGTGLFSLENGLSMRANGVMGKDRVEIDLNPKRAYDDPLARITYLRSDESHLPVTLRMYAGTVYSGIYDLFTAAAKRRLLAPAPAAATVPQV